jgi:hypothetical protein
MAGETVVLSANEISQLIQYASAFVVAVISGLAVSLGWVKAKHIKPEDVQVPSVPNAAGNEAIAQLTKAIQLLIDRLIEIHDDTARKEKREREVIEELSDDIRRLIHYLKSALTEKGV